MALVFLGGVQPPVQPSAVGVRLTLLPAFNVSTGLPSTDEVEVRRAPDNGGVPGTPETIARLPALSPQGAVFTDHLPLDGAVWWYSYRHFIADGAVVSGWSAWESAVADLLPTDSRTVDPAPANAGGVDTSSRYRVHAYNSGTQSLTNGGIAALTFDSELYDVGPLHDTTSLTSRLVIPAVNYWGAWHIFAQVVFAGNVTGYRYADIRKNGSTIIASQSAQAVSDTVAGAPIDHAMSVTTVDADPTAGDYYEIRALQHSGGDLNVQSGVRITFAALVHLW